MIKRRCAILDLVQDIQGNFRIFFSNEIDDSQKILFSYGGPKDSECFFHFLRIAFSILEKTSSLVRTFPLRISSSPCEISFRSPRAFLMLS